MKKIFLLAFMTITAGAVHAQVTSLNENFNTNCAVVGPNYPTYWSEYNVYPPTDALAWTCAPSGGRYSTPGIQCNNFDGTSYDLDTAWLLTPQLNLSLYTGSIYLQFDSKYFHNASKVTVLVSDDYHGGSPDTSTVTWANITSSLTPVFSPADSVGWITHQADLTAFKGTPIYVAFKYTSAVTGSGTWVLDNILTTQTPLNIAILNKNTPVVTILGTSTSSQVVFSYAAEQAGKYDVVLCDMMGRDVYKQSVQIQSGAETYTLNDLNLNTGLYVLKMGNGTVYSTAKVMIR